MGLAVLLVEDDQDFAEFLCRFLAKEGHEVEHASTGEQGVRLFGKQTPDLVLLDLFLPTLGGLEVLEQMKDLEESAPVIVMTANASIETAVQAMRLGALDYVTKPVDLEALGLKLEQAKKMMGLRSDLQYLLERERRSTDFENFVGDCPAMRSVYQKIREVAKTDNTTVLVTGESGTGKELVAGAVHALSQRSKKPLMQIDCTAIPVSLLESELFGHERGAFTGADRLKKGLLELADGGTLLLDEIGDMDLAVQGKFLRVLQERQFRRVGGTRDLRFDVRVIAATNQELERLSEGGRFRHELLYRLKVFQIELPPLKERGEDILKLADVSLSHYARAFRKPVSAFDAEARRALIEYSFPGNVRELRNIIEQAVILCKGVTLTRDLLGIPDPTNENTDNTVDNGDVAQGALSLDALGDSPLQAAERELIKQALGRSGGNKKHAAQLLGISRFALQRKLEKLAFELLNID